MQITHKTSKQHSGGWSSISAGLRTQSCKSASYLFSTSLLSSERVSYKTVNLNIAHSLGQNYPASMREQLGSRLPAFTETELRILAENKPKCMA